jgi:radical SAM superfamily enzyme YgiQ (UPF0313 family)
MNTQVVSPAAIASRAAAPVADARPIRSVFLIRVSSSVDKDVDHPQFFDPSYPLKYIEAGLGRREGVQVSALDCWIDPQPVETLIERTRQLAPELVVLSASSFEVEVADEYVRRLKAVSPDTLVVGIGQGHYFTKDFGPAEGEAVGPGYDAVLLGEPEEEIFELLDRMGEDRSAGAAWRLHYQALFRDGHRFAVQDSDVLAFPDYSADEFEAYRSIFPVRMAERVRWGYMIATRGCPHLCTFCSEVMRVSVGRKVRRRSAQNVVDEMEHLKRQGANILSFQDDSFSTSRIFVRQVCDEILRRQLDLPWMARVRADEVDRELLALMRRAGCLMLGMGVESGSQRIVDRVIKTHKPKPWADICRQTFAWTRELGIGTNAYYVIGSPGETREDIEQTIELALQLNSDTIQVHFFTPYPGSASWDEYKHLFGAEHDPRKMFHYGRPLFSLAEVSVDELIALRSRFYRRYIFRPGFIIPHLWEHKGFYWHNRDIFWTMVGIRKVF